MKCKDDAVSPISIASPPARGAWIEIVRERELSNALSVAPRTGGVD